MAVSLRRLRPDETRTFLEVHHTAVRVTAATDYSSEVVEAWAPLPITEDAVQSVLASAAAEIRVAAVSREKNRWNWRCCAEPLRTQGLLRLA
jgi:putative acetyltransferase